jgi:hypothetical protein
MTTWIGGIGDSVGGKSGSGSWAWDRFVPTAEQLVDSLGDTGHGEWYAVCLVNGG